MAKIMLHIQSLTMVDKDFLASSIHWAFWIGRHTSHTLLLSTPDRTSIDRGRNEAVKAALANDCDYVWFLDDDMPIEPHTLQSLVECDADIAMAHSYIRGYPYKPMCFVWTEGSSRDNPQGSALRLFNDDAEFDSAIGPNGLVEVAAVGFTCALLKCSIFKELQPPYFLTSPNQTEDVHFCLRCQFELENPIKVVVDTKVPTIHLGPREFISTHTVKALREYHEKVEGKVLQPIREDRDAAYLKQVEEL